MKKLNAIDAVVINSTMRKALETVIRRYESDKMVNMTTRDKANYKTCKEALKFVNKIVL